MNEFEFEGKKWEFMGWKDEQSFIARPGTNGKPRIITPVPALPEGAQWIAGKIIPNAVPVRVNRAYLLPPPCFDSEETAQGAAAVSSSILKAFNGTTYKQPEALFLSPGDNEELQKMLDAWKVEKKKEYDAARKEAKGIKDQTNRKTRIEAIKRQYEEPAYTFNGVECAGALNTTLNMVRAGAGDLPGPLGRRCLRDALLVDRWADSKGLDLYEMAANRKRFLTWLGKQASHNLPWSDDSPEFLNLCELVRGRIEFEGGAEAWLFDYRNRKPHSKDEFDFLRILDPKFDSSRKHRGAAGGRATLKAGAHLQEIIKHANEIIKRGSTKGRACQLTAAWAQEHLSIDISERTVRNYIDGKTGKL